MKCPVCVENNLKSKVYSGCSAMTAAYFPPYYDEDGDYHNHDGNTKTWGFECSNGHSWVEERQGICWWGWGKDIEPNITITKGISENEE